MNASAGSGPVDAELRRIESLLASNPAQAEAEAGRWLSADPGHELVRLFQGIARRLSGNPAGAIEVLEPLCARVPDAPLPHLQLGLALRETGRTEEAIEALRRAITAKPDFSDAWLALADLLYTSGNAEGADDAFGQYIRHSARDFPEATAALEEHRTGDAEAILREHLRQSPNDVRALCLLADVAMRRGRYDGADALLSRCLELAPSYRAARHNYAVVLMRRDKPAEALREIERLLAGEALDPGLLSVKAAALQRLNDYPAAIRVYEQILTAHPDEPGIHASLGHALRTIGRLDDCVAAYRKAAALAPDFGEAWWNLANLKTFRFTAADLESMRAQAARPELDREQRIPFHFALGKALEERGEFEESFRHYADGNRLRRETLDYDPGEITSFVARCAALFDTGFFRERAAHGHASREPVFVVGLPRSGSTLVEQILASHSAVEGTMELSHINDIVRSLAGKTEAATAYPERLALISEEESRELGGSYLERARPQRRKGTPLFIDKTPSNFLHLGLIHLILPNARIVDVRREPMACGWSVFRHLFARGHPFSYDLGEIGRYYRDYVALMAHFEAVLPGRVHRVRYEAMVEDTEGEVRRLLDYLELPFEAACLRYFENPRAVATPSSEQVRRPIFREGIDAWRPFEPWLGPLQRELDRPRPHPAGARR